MKKIGLLSVCNHNYGSILQAFALQRQIENLGYQTEIIRYKKTNIIKQASRLLYFPLLKATINMKLKSIRCSLLQRDVFRRVLVTRENEFTKFIEENFVFSKIYKGRSNLIKGTERYDGFVLGSDQVWNPMNLGGDFYTMTFIPEDKIKITYAPSFGVTEIPKYQKKKTSKYLKRIDYISVREQDGANIVEQLIGTKVPQVVDPTILINRECWDTIRGKKRIVDEKYIFCYFISPNKVYRSFAKKLAKKVSMKIVAIPHVDEFVKSDVGFGDIVPEGVGPSQFVNLISNAEFVCTDSFHGSVFSTLYERTFFSFSRYCKESADSTNSRIISFLKLIDMENRMYLGTEMITEEDLAPLDFSKAKKNLNNLRNDSVKYLERALKSV